MPQLSHDNHRITVYRKMLNTAIKRHGAISWALIAALSAAFFTLSTISPTPGPFDTSAQTVSESIFLDNETQCLCHWAVLLLRWQIRRPLYRHSRSDQELSLPTGHGKKWLAEEFVKRLARAGTYPRKCLSTPRSSGNLGSKLIRT